MAKVGHNGLAALTVNNHSKEIAFQGSNLLVAIHYLALEVNDYCKRIGVAVSKGVDSTGLTVLYAPALQVL